MCRLEHFRTCLLLACLCFTACGPAEKKRETTSAKPNILLLVAEDLGPRIGAFGDKLAQTPNIDELANLGVRYANTFTTSGVCAPSRAALIMGLHQISFGAHHMRSWNGPQGKYYPQPPRGLRAFPEILRAHGYFTFTDAKLDYQFSETMAGSGPFTLWDMEGATYLAWREAGDQPFFGMINFLQTHESGVMRMDAKPYSQTHAASQQMRRRFNLVAPSQTDPADVELPPWYPDLPAVRADLARHYDNIAQMDKQVGEIMAALREDGLWHDTIVLWTTDHGDGLPRAKRELLDSGIHVPMILHVPEAIRQQRSLLKHLEPGWDERLVSFVDLAPTLLQIAGLTPPERMHGTSFIAGALDKMRDWVLASRDRIDQVPDRQRALRNKRYKYIRSWHPDLPGGHRLAYRDNLDMVRAWRAALETGELNPVQRRWFEPVGKEQLYDLTADPFETRNLAASPAHATLLGQMRKTLEARLREIGDLGEVDEADLSRRFLHGGRDGKPPITPPPKIHIEGSMLRLSSEVDASIGFHVPGEHRLGKKVWRLYSGPIPAAKIEAKAVRYGWKESKPILIEP